MVKTIELRRLLSKKVQCTKFGKSISIVADPEPFLDLFAGSGSAIVIIRSTLLSPTQPIPVHINVTLGMKILVKALEGHITDPFSNDSKNSSLLIKLPCGT